MLNNANVLIKENPVEAVHVLSKLKDLLKYQLKDSTSETVYLADDIRFLTDYLNGDIYFKIHRKKQNLDRCRSQFALVADMEKKWDAMCKED